jgi:hypothetical protein
MDPRQTVCDHVSRILTLEICRIFLSILLELIMARLLALYTRANAGASVIFTDFQFSLLHYLLSPDNVMSFDGHLCFSELLEWLLCLVDFTQTCSCHRAYKPLISTMSNDAL